MNKIILEQEEITLKNDVVIENIVKKKVKIHIYDEINCGILNICDNLLLDIYVHKNAILNMDLFVRLKNINNKINLYCEDNAILNLNYACTYTGKNSISVDNFVIGNNTKTNIFIRAVENKGIMEIEANGSILENTKDNIYLEDIKALTNNNESIKIKPNLKVATNSVIANHNATISNVDESELFYLESKGISTNNAKKLIKLGFLKGILKLEEMKWEVMEIA